MAAVGAAGGYFVKLAADAETTATSFKVLIGSVDEANRVLADLRKFAAATPFEFPELADAGKKLLAFNVSTEELLPTLRRIGDISSGLQIPIGELAEIYGKARVQGRLFAEDVNQLTGRGIPVIQEFAKQFGVADSEVRKLVESGEIGFPQLEKAFVSLTSAGGKFNGMMAEQSTTLNGLLSTLQDDLTQMGTKFGELIAEGFRLNETLVDLTEESGKFGKAMDEAAPQLLASLQELNEEIGRIGSTLAGQTESITAYRMAFDLLNATLISVNKQIAALGDLVSLQDNITRTGGAITEAAMNIMFGGWTQGAETEAFNNLQRQLGDIWNDEPRQNPQAISESMKANREAPVKAPMLPDEPVVREQPQDWDAVRRNRTAPVKAPNLDLTDAEKNRRAPVLAPDPDFVREMTAEMKRNRAAPVLAPILPGDDEEAIDTTEFGRQEKKLPRGVGDIGTFSAAAAAMGALGSSPMLQELKTGNKTQKQILAKLDSIEKRGGLKFA